MLISMEAPVDEKRRLLQRGQIREAMYESKWVCPVQKDERWSLEGWFWI
jgi:hypothetical protein